MSNHKDLIAKWAELKDFAGDLDIEMPHARMIKSRGILAKEHWRRAAEGGRKRKIAGVTEKDWLNAVVD